MGNILPLIHNNLVEQDGMLKPIIYCLPNEDKESIAISINQRLAEKLIHVRPKRRSIKMETCFIELIDELPDNSVIKEFDVMFNPTYKVDVLKILISSCKKKNFSVIWPGYLKDDKLIYAEEGYPDFKEFLIDEYDITCVI